jgi:hypothetical protein
VFGISFDSSREMFETMKRINPELYSEFIEELKSQWKSNGCSESDIVEGLEPFLTCEDDGYFYDEEACTLEGFLKSKGRDLIILTGECTAIVGRDYQTLRNDETGLDFRTIAQRQLHDLFGRLLTVRHICDRVYSG